MRRGTALATGLALVLTGAAGARADLVGKPAPAIEFDGVWNGADEKALKDFQGRAVLLEVFTTW